jgi:hypothetical protein
VSEVSCPNARRSQRNPVTVHFGVRVDCKGKKAEYSALMIMASPLGATVRTKAPLSVDQTIDIMTNEEPSKPVPCRIVWVGKPGSEVEGHAGLEFLKTFRLAA